ncbi:MAG: hypothetical protein JNK82_16000 [Myxococcaceae bacterium]|nr:hypothetical protein [Myxococcaceae bacterium]
MKIVKNAAPGLGEKAGVGAGLNPFKRLMNGVKELKGSVVTPSAAQVKPPPLPLPGGVKPKKTLGARAAVLTPPPHLKAKAVQARSIGTAQATRETARAQANVKADNLVELRKESVAQNTQRYDTRLIDLICQELKIGFSNDEVTVKHTPLSAANSDRLPPVASQQQQASVTPITPGQTAGKNDSESKAASAVELIEKIETFVKSQRPGLALTLDGSLGARVEIERLGPKEVAIRVVGKNGPPAPEDIGRIREEMRARGLKVGALSVA